MPSQSISGWSLLVFERYPWNGILHYAQQAPQEHYTLGRCPRTCTMTWQHSLHHLSPHRWSTGILDTYEDWGGHWCGPTPIGSTTGLLGEQGASPLSNTFWGVYSSLWHLWTSLGLLEDPTTCILHHLTSWYLRDLLSYLWASLVGLSRKIS